MSGPCDVPPCEPVLTIKQHALVRHAMPMVEWHAKRIIWRYGEHAVCSLDDLVSVGKLALYKIAPRWDENVGTAFSDFGSMRAYGEMLDEVKLYAKDARIQRAVMREVMYHMAYYHDDFNILRDDDEEISRRLDMLADCGMAIGFVAAAVEAQHQQQTPEDEVADRDELSFMIGTVRDIVGELREPEQRLFRFVFDELHSVQDAADEFHVTYATVWLRIKRLLKRIREALVAKNITAPPLPRGLRLVYSKPPDPVPPPHEDPGRRRP